MWFKFQGIEGGFFRLVSGPGCETSSFPSIASIKQQADLLCRVLTMLVHLWEWLTSCLFSDRLLQEPPSSTWRQWDEETSKTILLCLHLRVKQFSHPTPTLQISITAALQARGLLNILGHMSTLAEDRKVTQSNVSENQTKPKQAVAPAVKIPRVDWIGSRGSRVSTPSPFRPAFLCIDFTHRLFSLQSSLLQLQAQAWWLQA